MANKRTIAEVGNASENWSALWNSPRPSVKRKTKGGVYLQIPECLSLYFEEGFVERPIADELLRRLRTMEGYEQGEVKLFDKLIKEPRLTAWFGEFDYSYSGRDLKAVQFPNFLEPLRNRVREVTGVKGINSCLINYYRNGDDYIGWHSDNERALGPNRQDVIVASLSFGQRRDFRMKHIVRRGSCKDTKDRLTETLRREGRNGSIGMIKGEHAQLNIALDHGTLLIMRGDTQKHWKHMVPKRRGQAGERINVTFRMILPSQS